MRIFVDLDSNQVILAPGVTAQVTTLGFKRSAAAQLEVQFVRDREVVELEVGASGVFGIKETGKYDADYVTAALGWVKTGTGSDTVYTFSLNFITDALDALFLVDDDPDNDVATITLMGELEWTEGGNTSKTPTLTVQVANDVIRTGDTVPEMPAIAYAVFLNGITELTGGTIGEDPLTHLDAVPTAGLQTGYVIQLLVEVGGVLEWLAYRLVDGPATDDAPGQVEPLDYDAGTNDRHWEGAVGPSGPAGTSTTWRVGSGVPNNATGNDGDLYLRTTNGDVYQRASGTYSVVANIKGSTGDPGVTGPSGATWRSGSAIPDNATGADGDFYFRTATSDIYKRASGVYSIIANIKGDDGDDGDTGATGSTGATGADGNTILSGSGAPSSGLGVNGNFYIDTSARAIYGPKTSGAWGSATSLIGPTGPSGGASRGARVYNSASISVANSTATALTFDSERDDSDTIHDTGSNTGRLTCKTAGIYLIYGTVRFAANATGFRELSIRLNGSTFVAQNLVPAPSSGACDVAIAAAYTLALTDYVELVATQTSGGALNVIAAGNYSPEFGMVLVSAAPGTPGSVWRSGSGVPSDSLGINGDYYLNTANGDVYTRSSGTYSLVTNIKGLAGTNGATWRTGSGIPSDGTGVDGDLYLRTSTGAVYQRASGTYSVIVNITGPAGIDGTDGSDGADGEGVPTGGTAGQVLAKIDGTDFNSEWTDPPTGTGVPDGGTTGQVLTKLSGADGDADWEDIPGSDIGARVYNSSNIATSNNTPLALDFDTERFDTDTIHDATHPSRLTCHTAGKYLIFASLRFAANATGWRDAVIRLNGSTVIGRMNADSVNTDVTALSLSTVFALAENDYIEVVVTQNSGGTLNVSAAPDNSPEFGMVLLKSGSGGGGGGGGWDEIVDEDGSSLANWTSVTGTWSSSGTYFEQTNTSSGTWRLQHTDPLPTAGCFIELEVWVESSGFSSSSVAGVELWDGTLNGGPTISLRTISGVKSVSIDSQNTSIESSKAYAWVTDSWVVFRIYKAGDVLSLWVDGNFMMTAHRSAGTPKDESFLNLFSFQGGARFRNVKLWTPTFPT
jgi:hypothetical protein